MSIAHRPFYMLRELLRPLQDPCPDPRASPGAALVWCRRLATLRETPGYEELEKYSDSMLREPRTRRIDGVLTLTAHDRICRDAVARLEGRNEDLDLLSFQEVAEVLWDAEDESLRSSRGYPGLTISNGTPPVVSAAEAHKTTPDAPRDLAELARIVRRDNPRQGHVAALLEYMHRNESATFDEIRDQVHGSDVEDETVEGNLKNARTWIVKYGMPFRLRKSGTTISRKGLVE